MAKLIQAIQAYGPKVTLTPTAQLDELSEWMAGRTGLNQSEVTLVLNELKAAIITFSSRGIPINLPGVGTIAPSISRRGEFRVNLRADKMLRHDLNRPNQFRGHIANKSRIGLDNDGFKSLWDTDHPGDPLEL